LRELIPGCKEISTPELDQRLERAVRQHERAERQICAYLLEMSDRRGHEAYGFSSIFDYAAERFGFSERKTAYLLTLARRLKRLPHLAEALASGKLGWTKAVKVAQVATAEDEVMWVDSALRLSVRELERKIRSREELVGGRVSFWLTGEQSAVWQRALEVCRRLSGANLEPSQCLELIAGEFLATYEALGGKEGHDEPEEPAPGPKEEAGAAPPDDTLMCPEGEELPSPVAAPYSKTHRRVLERDGYCCKYPACSSRMNLHVHHVEYRSRSGTKGKAASNSEVNCLCLCHVHHRMVHAGIIGVQGKAPDQLEWRRPKLMDEAAARMAESRETLSDLIEDEPEGPEGEDDEVWLPAGYSPSWDEPAAARSR
jgi:hypothetical protein